MEKNDLIYEKPLIGQTMSELEIFAKKLGEESFRGRQLFDWIYRQQIYDFSVMTNLSKSFRKKIKTIPIQPLKILKHDISISKLTRKFLFELTDGNQIESVLMKEGNRITVCVSTQVGCAVDCNFCATAKMGFKKNLTAGEIVDQFLQLQKIISEKITNVVFMGMGEPFLNYGNSITAANLLHNPKGINMGAGRITLSTAGIIPKIRQFTEENLPYKLAVSLNGSNSAQRFKTMPVTKTHSFKDLIKASKEYAYKSRNRITFEYVLMAGINDKPRDAERLKYLLNSMHCKLNVIPYNEIGGQYQRPEDKAIEAFLNPLKNAGFSVTIRWSKGIEIEAGCGQLVTMNQ